MRWRANSIELRFYLDFKVMRRPLDLLLGCLTMKKQKLPLRIVLAGLILTIIVLSGTGEPPLSGTQHAVQLVSFGATDLEVNLLGDLRNFARSLIPYPHARFLLEHMVGALALVVVGVVVLRGTLMLEGRRDIPESDEREMAEKGSSTEVDIKSDEGKT